MMQHGPLISLSPEARPPGHGSAEVYSGSRRKIPGKSGAEWRSALRIGEGELEKDAAEPHKPLMVAGRVLVQVTPHRAVWSQGTSVNRLFSGESEGTE
ncbi:hypothetical protein SKAU_G00229350 [Synaphobranchus kaupii]|uniref:Uncharacterized protein n=1 Tax=Synaphobranchus kaupii TaxID=118154 RepID=A0A9Q1IT42_SYNKA|nr:hypothetical protein SKAU_G00229350 [Synaphobranchus kaupii]